jgi:hypothetical protein
MSKFKATLATLVNAKQEAAAAYNDVIDNIDMLFAPVEGLYHAAIAAGIDFDAIEDLDDWAHDRLAEGFAGYDAAEADLMAVIVNDIIVYSEELEAFLAYSTEKI